MIFCCTLATLECSSTLVSSNRMSSRTLSILGLSIFLLLPPTFHCNWISSMAQNNVLRLKNLKDKFLRASETTSSERTNLVKSSASPISPRDYGGGGMGFPSLETSLTTLAFLSFGAFLLSMMMKALNITSGRRRRDLSFLTDDKSGYDVYDFSEAVFLALNSLNSAIFEEDFPSCQARALCQVFSSTERKGGLVAFAPTLTRFALNWLHERRPSLISPSKWKLLTEISTTNKCEDIFLDCNDAHLVDTGGGKLRNEKGKRRPRTWSKDEKSKRFKTTNKWPWTNHDKGLDEK